MFGTQKNNQEVVACLSSVEVRHCFDEATVLIDVDINTSLLKFNEGLLKAGRCVEKTITVGKEKKHNYVV